MKNQKIADQKKLINTVQILAFIGKSRSTLWRWIRSGHFPAPLKIGPNSIAWTQEQLTEWLLSKCDQQEGLKNV